MSGESNLGIRVKQQGADDAIAKIKQLHDELNRGSITNKEYRTAIRDTTTSTRAATQEFSQIKGAIYAANPTLLEFSRTMSAFGQVASTALAITNAINLAILSTAGQSSKMQDLKVAIADARLEYERFANSPQFGPSSPQAQAALSKLTELQNSLTTATREFQIQQVINGITFVSSVVLIGNQALQLTTTLKTLAQSGGLLGKFIQTTSNVGVKALGILALGYDALTASIVASSIAAAGLIAIIGAVADMNIEMLTGKSPIKSLAAAYGINIPSPSEVFTQTFGLPTVQQGGLIGALGGPGSYNAYTDGYGGLNNKKLSSLNNIGGTSTLSPDLSNIPSLNGLIGPPKPISAPKLESTATDQLAGINQTATNTQLQNIGQNQTNMTLEAINQSNMQISTNSTTQAALAQQQLNQFLATNQALSAANSQQANLNQIIALNGTLMEHTGDALTKNYPEVVSYNTNVVDAYNAPILAQIAALKAQADQQVTIYNQIRQAFPTLPSLLSGGGSTNSYSSGGSVGGSPYGQTGAIVTGIDAVANGITSVTQAALNQAAQNAYNTVVSKYGPTYFGNNNFTNPSGNYDPSSQPYNASVIGSGSGAAARQILYGGMFAGGLEGIVSSPTMFIAGESGPEHISITPSSKSGGKASNIIISISGNVYANNDFYNEIQNVLKSALRRGGFTS